MVSKSIRGRRKEEEVEVSEETRPSSMTSTSPSGHSKKNSIERLESNNSSNSTSSKRLKRTYDGITAEEHVTNEKPQEVVVEKTAIPVVDEFELASAVALVSLATLVSQAPTSVTNKDESEKKTSTETTPSGAASSTSANSVVSALCATTSPVKREGIVDEPNGVDREAAQYYGAIESRSVLPQPKTNNSIDDKRQLSDYEEAENEENTTETDEEGEETVVAPKTTSPRGSGEGYVRTTSKEEDLSITSAIQHDAHEPAPVTPEKTTSRSFQSSHESNAAPGTDPKNTSNHQSRRVHFAPGVKKEETMAIHPHQRGVGGGPSLHHSHHQHPHYHHNHAQLIQRLQLPSSNNPMTANKTAGPGTSPPKRLLPPHHARAYSYPPAAQLSASSPSSSTARVGPMVQVMDHHPSLPHPRVHSWPPHRTTASAAYHHAAASFMPPPPPGTRMLQASGSASVAGTASTASGNTGPGSDRTSTSNKSTNRNLNGWVCDYCHAVSFATFEEACIHEETCSARPGAAVGAQASSAPPAPKSHHVVHGTHPPTPGRVTTLRPWPHTPPSSSSSVPNPSRGTSMVVYPPKPRPPQLHHHPRSGAFLPLHAPHHSHHIGSLPRTADTALSASPYWAAVPPGSTNQWSTGSVPLGIANKDSEWLSAAQCLIRAHCVEAFAADISDVAAARKSRISLHQVGIRCRFCKCDPKQQQRQQRQNDNSRNDDGNGSVTDPSSNTTTDEPQELEEHSSFVAFPSSLTGIFEAVKRWQKFHAAECPSLPADIKTQLENLTAAEQQQQQQHQKPHKEQEERQEGHAQQEDPDSKDSDGDRTEDSRSTRQYWVDSAKALGMVDTLDGIRFGKDPTKSPPNVSELDGSMKFLKAKGGSMGANGVSSPVGAAAAASRNYQESMRVGGSSDDGSIGSQQTSGDYIVYANDTGIVPPYVYFLMRQVESCRFTEADRFVARSKGPVGYPGFQCRHCHGHAGLGKYFPVSSKSLSTNSTSQNIHAHLLKCRQCPIHIKNQLVALKEEKAKAPRLEPGWRKIFFDKIWVRLHGTPPDPR